MKILDKAVERLNNFMAGGELEINSADEQPESDKKLAQWVRGKLEDRMGSGARLANEATWLTNIAYLCGVDSVEFDSKTRQFRAVNSLPRGIAKSRVYVNKVLPTYQNRLAKLCKNPPRWDVRPKSSEDEDKEASRLGKQVILNDWDTLQINKKRLILTGWLQVCGHAYGKISWDINAGPKTMLDGQVVFEGDKRFDVVSAFQGFPDPLAETWEDITDFIHAKVRPLSYFAEAYPERGKLVKAEDTWVTSLQYEQRINAFSSLGGAQTNNPSKNTAIEISYYEKPSVKHPKGRHIISANGVMLKDGVLAIDEIPFAKFDDIIIPGKFNSEAVTTHLRPMQDQYNRNKTVRAAWINRLVAGKYIAARGANLGPNAFNDQSGEIVEYDAVPNASEPHAVQIPNIPDFIYKEDEGLRGDINDVSGINETSRGQMASASIPAIGMQFLIEQDDSRVGVETEQHEYAYADLGRILLKFTGKYYTKDRLLKVAGKGMDYIVRTFKGEDLRDNFDVHVIRGSTLPGSKVLNRQDIKTLHQEGYFGNPQDPKVIENVLSMLEFGDEFEPWKRQSLTMNQIQKGISSIEAGQAPIVSEFDNHPMWIQELNDYRLSDRFTKLTDESKMLVLACMEAHATELQRMVAPDTMDDPDTVPDLVETTAAQDMEEQAMNEQPQDIPPQAPIPQEVM